MFNANESKNYTITFNVTGVKEGTVGYLLLNDGSGWRMIPTTVGNGTMTGTFDKLGLVAFVLDKTTVPGGSTTSPQTSASAAALVGLVGIAAASGAVVLKKKER